MQKPILLVNEVFGPTFQGEGPSQGRRAVFLRLAMCNLKCSWCDTPYTWDWIQYAKGDEVHAMPLNEVFKLLHDVDDGLPNLMLVITGGEPMLQSRNLYELVSQMEPFPYDAIEIETNGTIKPLDERLSDHVNYIVSPKLENSGNSIEKRQRLDALSYYAHEGSTFKFVVQSLYDLDEIQQLAEKIDLLDNQIWIMAEAKTALDVRWSSQEIAQEVLNHGWNLTTRLQVLLWGSQRAK